MRHHRSASFAPLHEAAAVEGLREGSEGGCLSSYVQLNYAAFVYGWPHSCPRPASLPPIPACYPFYVLCPHATPSKHLIDAALLSYLTEQQEAPHPDCCLLASLPPPHCKP
jgi:hypothetical protein